MRRLFTSIILIFFISFVCHAQVTKKSIKSSKNSIGQEIPPYNGTRQGGDDISNATVITTLPYSDNGTTSVYTNDYFGDCSMPGDNNKAEDVVYSYSPSVDELVNISLCGSDFNTILYVFENTANNIPAGWCNDDYCNEQSQLDNLSFTAGNTYYIVVDGYKTSNGDYEINITNPSPPPFEIRIIEDTDGLLTVQMKATTGYVPVNGTVISDIGFALRWPMDSGVFYVTDVALVCTDYNIEPFDDVDSYYTAGGWNFRSYTQSSNYTVTSGWTADTWETIAKFRTVEVNGWSSSGWPFEIAPDGWLNSSWGADPLWEQDFSPYIPNINGSVSGYDFPRYYSMIWSGGESDAGVYDEYSWNYPQNWETICGLPEPYAPDTYANCIIPSGATYYPRYSQPVNSDQYTSYCYDLLIEAGGEVNFTGDHSSNNYTQLYIDNDLTIEDGGTPGKLDLVNDALVDVSNDIHVYGNNSLRVGLWSYLLGWGDLNIYATEGLVIEKTGWVQATAGTTHLGAPSALVIKEGDGNQPSATGGGPGNFAQIGNITYGANGSASISTFIKNNGNPDPNFQSFYIHMVGPTVNDPDYTGPGTGVPLGNFDLLELGTYAYYWDEPNYQWVNIYPIPYPVPTATGLILSDTSYANNTYTMEGEIITGNITKWVTQTWEDTSYVLISNPYPCALDWHTFYWSNRNLIKPTYYIHNPQNGNYATYNYYSQTGTNGATQGIQQGQGFFVLTEGNGNIAFSDNDKFFSRFPILKNRDEQKKLSIESEGNGYKDECLITFIEGSTKEYDIDYDSKKWSSYYTIATEIYSLSSDNIKLSINSQPSIGGEVISVPVHFKCGADSIYKLTFKNLNSLATNGAEVWLEDKAINTDWLQIGLQDSIYEFNGTPEDDIDRFIVHFFGPTGIDDEINGEDVPLKIYAANSNLYILNDSDELIKEVVVYTMMGSEILRTANIRQSLYRMKINTSTGYYIVKVLTDKNVYSEKVFIMK